MAIQALLGFVSQMILLYILWNLGTKVEINAEILETIQTERTGEFAKWDEDGKMQPRIWH